MVAFCLIMLLSMPVSSQSFRPRRSAFEGGDDYHFGFISGSVGYSMMQTSVPYVMPRGGVGGSVGLGYEFRNSGFWANLGAQLSFHRSTFTVDQYDTRSEANQAQYHGFDNQGKPATFHYRVNQTDEMQWNYIDVPLLVGYYVRGFHVGGGIKVSYALAPKTRTYGTYHLFATNDDYAVPFGELDNEMADRGYTDYTFDQRIDNRLNVGVSLLGEIGYDLLSSLPTSSRICNVLKLAFYVEYGLNNQLRNNDNPAPRVELPVSESGIKDATQAVINPQVNTFDKPARTVPLFTGVKLTYMIGGSRTARVGFHHGCMCYN